MIPDLVLEPKPEHGSPEWLAARHRDSEGRARLTASVAGVLFDCHEFITPADLALQMLHDEAPDTETTEAMERGTALEPSVIQHWADKHGEQVEKPTVMFVRDRWLANLDGVCWVKDAPVEAKTTTHRFKGELFEYWHWQGVAQRLCFAGTEGTVQWSILDGDLRFRFYEQYVTPLDMRALVERGNEWLSYIDLGMPPLGVNLNAKQVATLNEGESGAVELPAEAPMWLRRLQDAKALKKQGEQDEKDAKDWIANHLGGADVGTLNGQTVVTWKEQAGRRGFAVKEFAVEYPDLYEKFMRQGDPFRVMLPKGS